jgi:hypothetical protein
MAVMQKIPLAKGLIAATERTFLARHVTLRIDYLWVVMSDIKCCLTVNKHKQKHFDIITDKFNTHKIFYSTLHL